MIMMLIPKLFNFKHLAVNIVAVGLLLGMVACQSATTPEEERSGDGVEESTEVMPGAGITVRSAHSSLPEERFQTEVVNRALQALGYETAEPVELEYAAIFPVIANGDLEFMASHWEGNQADMYKNSGGGDTIIKLNTLVRDGLQGYQIDKKTADAQGITNIELLKDPEIAKLFDTDGNGKANLTGCNPGWGCEFIIEHHLDVYGLRDTVEQDRGKYSALIADVATRYEQGEPVLYYTWMPFWLNVVLKPDSEVVWLAVPFTALPGSQTNITEAETTTRDGINLGFSHNHMKIVANQQFVTDNPAAKKLFEIIEIPIEDVSAQNLLMYEGEDSPEDVARHVDDWVSRNQTVFDGWVAEARLADS